MPEIKVDEARWDALLATDESQALLEWLADEVLAEFRTGQTRPMAFSADGRIVPMIPDLDEVRKFAANYM